MKIIFILHNIFEIKNGVSSKYIRFINYLIKNKINYLLITTFIKKENLKKYSNYNILYEKGIELPFYKNIKIPNLNIDNIYSHIKGDEIIIFNGELFIYYDIFILLRKHYSNLKLIPNWHTNYDYYFQLYFHHFQNFNILKKSLIDHLSNNIFNGIICTGILMEKYFKSYTNQIINANEICVEDFNHFKIDKYNDNQLNFIYTGRISIEKNIEYIFEILQYIIDIKYNIEFKFHLIGDGPHLNQLKKKIKNELLNHIHFYDEINYSNIINIYKNLDNRLFISTSKSETFGKSSMEACHCGIPLFIIDCELNNLLYHENNAFLFKDKKDFVKQLTFFLNMNTQMKELLIHHAYENSLQYDQDKIFNKLLLFLQNINENKNNNDKKININKMGHLLKAFKWSLNFLES